MQTIGIFGGTFDPIHQGHIKTCLTIQEHFKFDSFYFMPCKAPVLKSPSFTANEHRIKMLELALEPFPLFSIDQREILRNTPSYMVLSLQDYKKQYPEAALTVILGYDAFARLDEWYEWKKIPQLCNLIIINRDHQDTKKLSQSLQTFAQANQVKQPDELIKHQQGALLFFDAGKYDISSTQIRSDLQNNKPINEMQIPKTVLNYINQQGLYR